MANEPRVVILGAGFGGLGVIKKLEKAPVSITLIDRNAYHSFLPLLYQVATCELGPTEVGFPARELLHDRSNAVFHKANVTGIDLDAKQVLAEGLEPVPYDYLVVALGAVVNFFGTKGSAENAYPLYTLQDAVGLKEHILDRFEAVDKAPGLVEEGALRFCVVGGGATGVETAGAIAELLQGELKDDYPNLPVDKAEVHLYELGPALLPQFKAKLQAYAKKALEERDVKVHLDEGVVEIEPTVVHLKSGEAVKAHTLVWAAGLMASPLAGAMETELTRGRVPVGPGLNLEDHPEVYVIGDMALITDAKTKQPLPQLGSVAQQAGMHVGENIARLVVGKKPEPFEYEDKGTMATIGRGAAVVELHSGRTMTGNAAWLAWLGVHMMLLSGGEQKGITFVDWGWNVLTKDRGKRIVIE